MEKKNILLALVLALSLAGAAGAGLWLQSGTDPAPPPQATNLIISELCTKNETVIADNTGKYRDYIELYNAGACVDLTGCYLTDGKVSSPAFSGPVLEAGESWLVFLGDQVTGFGLGAKGGDTVQLMDAQGNILAQTNTAAMQEDQVMLYRDGDYIVSYDASPGFSNDASGLAAFRTGTLLTDPAVTVSEVLVSNESVLPDENGNYSDLVELHNTTAEPVRLAGWYLSDSAEHRFVYRLPDVTLEAGGYLVIFCDGQNRVSEEGLIHAGFGLSLGDTLCLTDRQGGYVTASAEPQGEDISLALTENGYGPMLPSPGYENTDGGTLSFRESRVDCGGALVISEVLLSSARTPYQGTFQDVAEILNRSDAPVSTAGWYLSDGGDPYEYALPEATLEPGACMVVVCSPGTTGFGLSDGEVLRLTGPEYRHLPEVACTAGEPGQSICLADPENLSYDFDQVSLGYANTGEGHQLYLREQLPQGLRISEVMSANDSYLRGSYATTSDWLELYNASGQTLDLSDYAITNNPGNLEKFPLPQATLGPGEYCVILLSNDTTNLPGGYPVLPFTVSSQGESLYLSREGKIEDYALVPPLARDVSYGRAAGSARFDLLGDVTPGAANGDSAGVCAAPVAVTAQGSYDGVEYLDVELTGQGQIYYTTDATAPDAYDKLYTGPIRITRTTVIRAVCVEQGKKTSQSLDLTYLINENDTLPTVCIVSEPSGLFSQDSGIYTLGPNASGEYPYYNANYFMDWERGATVSLFETDGSVGFSSPCGIKIFGAFSRAYPKKSLACFFRSRYGADSLSYPLFGEESLDTYETFVLRACGQDVFHARLRDEVITSVAGDYTDLAVQDYRPVVVYLNGSYYGLHYIREKLNEQYVSGHYGVEPETVTVCEGNGELCAEYRDLVSYAASHDLSRQEHYDYICARMDVDVYMDHIISQLWIANDDNGNVKFFLAEGRKWHWFFYDTDLSMHDASQNTLLSHLDPWGTAGGYISTELINALLDAPQFREAFLERMAWMLNNVWTPENLLPRIDELEAAIETDMVKDCARWGTGYDQWVGSVEELRSFVRQRTGYLTGYVQSYFGLTDGQMRGYGFDV